MSKTKQLISGDQARVCKRQHTKPCSDGPWSRKALPGWLAAETPFWWLVAAHGDGKMECHTKRTETGSHECAGASIFRSNVVKDHAGNLKLPKDKETVFANDQEFAEHHLRRPVSFEEIRNEKLNELLK
jgi:hypothetical protein